MTTAYAPLGVHLVGSIPLRSSEEVFATMARELGDRLRRIPDGETGPRADWIVWQYPVLSARPEFEIGPPEPGLYRPLPRLRLRAGVDRSELRFESLGYAAAARASYRDFARLKRDRLVPSGCRFQVSLPTPLAPISAFVAQTDQAAVEAPYEARMLDELDEIVDAIPHDQLAVQWDTNFEFGMLDGAFPAWFADVKGGILERLLRLSRRVPPDVHLGFHLCHGERGSRREQGIGRMVEVANALSASLGRELNWIHLPMSGPGAGDGADAADAASLEALRLRPETELYLGLLDAEDGAAGARRRIEAARGIQGEFGAATECGWGRRGPALLPRLIELHREMTRPVSVATAEAPGVAFAWPEPFPRVPDEEWVTSPVDPSGLQYDTVDNHGWYRNLDLTVEQLAGALREGDVLIDYSGGTGILLDRLRLRIFDREVGMAIVDSSPKFLRVALDRFRNDHRVAFRQLHYLREERRLQRLDEVLGPLLTERPVDAIVSTNAIHLYTDLGDTLTGWRQVLCPGGRVFVNSGNVRNPAARPGEWILDETVAVVHEVAMGLVRTDDRYAAYRDVLDDPDRMRRHNEFRDRVFIAPRPLDFYTTELTAAGFRVDAVDQATIVADVDDWFEFLKAYHDAVLGWVGGTARIEGAAPTDEAVADRLALLRHAIDVIFGGRHTFRCCWTYLQASRAA